MKKLAFLIIVLLAGCTAPPAKVLKSEYVKLQDSITVIYLQKMNCTIQIQLLQDSIVGLQDSIVGLNQQPLMTDKQFQEIYKYETLKGYWDRCVKNSSQWVNYRGWCARIFNQK